MQKLPLLLLLVICSQGAFCQVNRPKNKQELIALCDKFMATFKNQKYNEAFDLVKSYTVIEDYKLDTLAKKSQEQMNALSGYYGKMTGYEQIAEKPAKNSLSKLIYLLKFEKYFLKFRFILYNNGTGWAITNIKYDEELDDLFQ